MNKIESQKLSEYLRTMVQTVNIISGCPICLYQNNYSNSILLDSNYSESYFDIAENDSKYVTSLIQSSKNQAYIISDPDNKRILYGIFHINNEYSIVVGPFCPGMLALSDEINYMRNHHGRDLANKRIIRISVKRVSAIISHINTILNNTKLIIHDQSIHEPISAKSNSSNSKTHYTNPFQPDDKSSRHHPYSLEKKILACIRNGHPEYLDDLDADWDNYELGTMAFSQAKQYEYAAVLCVSAAAREAIAAGVNPYIAYDLNDEYLQRVSKAGTIYEYLSIFKESAHRFSKVIQENVAENCDSSYISNCKHYILSHIKTPFTLNDLAEFVNLTPTYLSSLFSASEGITIKQFTLNARLDAAQNLLRYSDYSISDISSYLCFCSLSYFSSTYKKAFGISPSEFRQRVAEQGSTTNWEINK